MKTIFNFSHPLNERTIQQITDAIGENTIHTIRVQSNHIQEAAETLQGFGKTTIDTIQVRLDPEQPIRPQIIEICKMAYAEFGEPDYLVLPGKAEAAGFVTQYFSEPQDDYPPVTFFKPVIWVKQDRAKLVSEFILGGIE